MKYLILSLVSALLIISQATAQANNSTIPDTASNSTTDASTNSTSTNSTGGSTDETPSTGSPVEMESPDFSDACGMVFTNCTTLTVPEPSVCGANLEEVVWGCMESGIDAENMTYECTPDDFQLLETYCFGTRLLSMAAQAQNSMECQVKSATLAQLNGDKVNDITEESGEYCSFLDDYETEFKTADQNVVCSEVEYDKLHEEACDFASRGAVASLALVVAMVMAQWVF